MTDKMDDNGTTDTLDPTSSITNGLDAYNARERAWLTWFYSLSEDDQKIVELCGEKGISVTHANFDKMKEFVKDR